MTAFITGIPKAELHMHLEGSIEPEMMFTLAARNGLRLRWETPAALRAAYDFTGLEDFLALYFEGCRVLVTRQDFHDIASAYLARARQDNVIRAEMFLGPQSFTERDVPIGDIIEGVLSAIDASGVSAGLLVSAHRHRTEAEALALLDSIMPWAARITGIGMGGAEAGNPPSKFTRFFAEARKRGFRTTIHAGEEGPAAYVRQALDLLAVDRIDHGVACMDDPALVRDLATRRVPLTVCPLSNVRLKVTKTLAGHPLRRMLEAGLNVSVHSDDPPYFGGYVVDNMIESARALHLTADHIATLACNSFAAAFMPADDIERAIAQVDIWCAGFQWDKTAS